MRRRIRADEGRAPYARRFAIIEPVFTNLRHNQRLDYCTLRDCNEVDAQWKLFWLVHDIEKLADLKYAAQVRDHRWRARPQRALPRERYVVFSSRTCVRRNGTTRVRAINAKPAFSATSDAGSAASGQIIASVAGRLDPLVRNTQGQSAARDTLHAAAHSILVTASTRGGRMLGTPAAERRVRCSRCRRGRPPPPRTATGRPSCAKWPTSPPRAACWSTARPAFAKLCLYNRSHGRPLRAA